MSTALIELGFQRPKMHQLKVTLREICIIVAWVSLVLMVGLSVASSIQATDQVAYDISASQGL
ncbi:MAG: hypothetical protein WCJ60_04540 [bacterium]